ncbi:MAG: superoxide dismutase [Gammaproteobacteria bacterium]
MKEFLADEPCACEPMGGDHILTELPYKHASLAPHIDERTMQIHHTKHHASYVKKLNGALEGHDDLRERSAWWLLLNLESVPESIKTAVRNNAGGHVNHCLFWHAMSPSGARKPSGALAQAIDRDLGGFTEFKKAFEDAGKKVFGSGWVWLVADDGGTLRVTTTLGHDNPAADGLFPVLVNDVWEHAYYLKHQNERGNYLDGWWAVVDWDQATRRHARYTAPAP